MGNLKEALLPYVIWKARLYSVGYRIATRMSPASVEKEVMKMTWQSSRKDLSMSGHRKKKSRHESGDAKVSDDEESLPSEEDDNGVPSLTQAEVESAMKKVGCPMKIIRILH